MSTNHAESYPSSEDENEIFFGKLTLKEIRARLLPKETRRSHRTVRLANENKVSNIISCAVKPEENNKESVNEVPCDFKSSKGSNYSTPSKNVTNFKEISFLNLSLNDSFLQLERQFSSSLLNKEG